MKIAVIGSGIAGLSAAWLLSKRHQVTLIESGPRLGGHTATIDVPLGGRTWAVDTGFIVFNDWTYPNFIRLMSELGVASQETDMGFSVKCAETGFEYCGSNLNGLFAQRHNLFSPAFWGMLRDILRFNREAAADLDAGRIDASMTLGEYLSSRGYGQAFRERYLVPMGAAIWSSGLAAMAAFPVHFFVRFFRNHGLLSIDERPQWRVIQGGSRSYIEPMSAPFRERIRLAAPVRAVRRLPESVAIRCEGAEEEHFEQVVIAAHSDQALAMLADASPEEREILGALPYQDNDVVLHTDASLLPRRRRAWASWNYHLASGDATRAVLTYNMNMLQRLEAPEIFCVTLNHTAAIDPQRVIGRYRYAHPVFTPRGMLAQQRRTEISGVRRTWFCGAYWHNGFHEDGVRSAVEVAHGLGVDW